MAAKTNGVEFKRFYSDPEFWPDGVWHEEETVLVDGKEADSDTELSEVPDTSKISISGGIVFGPKLEGREPSFELYFRRWKKQQSTMTFVVECPIALEVKVKAHVKLAGGKVV